jgi:heavy metal efflux system protein
LVTARFSTLAVQRPLAIVVVGGMLLVPLPFLTMLPAMIGSFS